MKNFNNFVPRAVKFIEKFLAFIVLAAVILYIFNSFLYFYQADWQSKEVFYELIYRVLLATIGLELARMFVTHNFLAILELLAFVVARKMLKPELTTVDVLLGVVAFSVLLVANRFLVIPVKKSIKHSDKI